MEEEKKTIEEIITEAMAAPASVSVDGQTVNSRSAADIIKLANYAAAMAARKNGGNGLRVQKIMPGGANGL